MKRFFKHSSLACIFALALSGCDTSSHVQETPDGSSEDSTNIITLDIGYDGGQDIPAPPEPFKDLAVDEEYQFEGLNAPVHVVRDELHMPHIYASNLEDAFYAQGYIHAIDRFGQMELFRRTTAGRLSELTGSLDEGSIRDDIFNRTLGFRRIAQQQVDALDSESDAFKVFWAYAHGVNQFIKELRSEDRSLPSLLGAFIPTDTIEDWTPADSLAIVRYQGFSLGFDGYREISLTADYEAILEAFPADSEDPARAMRAGVYGDLLRWAPVDPTVQFEVHPPENSGLPPFANAMTPPPSAMPATSATQRPSLPNKLLTRADRFFDRPHLWIEKGGRSMSNNWVVGGDLTESGHPIVCNDPHLALNNPPLFYFSHVVISGTDASDDLFTIGASFPGVPGVLLGHNEHIAWATTTASFDYSDVYMEDFTASEGDASPTVAHDGGQKDVTVLTDTVKVGSFGQITKEISFPIYITHRNAIMVTEITADGVTPLESGPQLSFGWLGFDQTPEIQTVIGNMVAKDVDEMLQSLAYWHIGGANFVAADVHGDIISTGASKIPIRKPGAMTFDADTNPSGTAPWWILPGDGSADWDGFIPANQVPFVRNPEKGFSVTANNDQVGQTVDNDPLNEDYYLGYDYDIGFRGGRITRMLDGTGPFSPAENGKKLTLEDMVPVLADTFSGMGDRLNALLLIEIEKLVEEYETPGTHVELSEIVLNNPDALSTIQEAHSYLQQWDFTTPAAVDGEPSEEEIKHSVATTIFNYWLVKVVDRAVGDEQAEMGRGVRDQYRSRAIVLMMENKEGSLRTLDPSTGESVLWDRFDTPDIYETRSQIINQAFLTALTEAQDKFGSDSAMEDWRWGELHRLNLTSLVPVPGGLMDLPMKGKDHFGKGYPRPGDNYAVNVCNPGVGDTNFKCGSGPIMRFCVEMDPEGPRSYNMLPGGLVYDMDSPHVDDWLPGWLNHTPTYWPLSESEVEQASKLHIRMVPTTP